MTDKLRDDLAEVVNLMNDPTRYSDEVGYAAADFIRTHHAQIQRNAEDASRYRRLRKMQNRELDARILTESMNVDAGIDAAMRANGGEVE